VDAPSPDKDSQQGVSNVGLVEAVNAALSGMEGPTVSPIRHCQTDWSNWGDRAGMDSEEAAGWFNNHLSGLPFLGGFAPGAAIKVRTFLLVVQFIPLHFKPERTDS